MDLIANLTLITIMELTISLMPISNNHRILQIWLQMQMSFTVSSQKNDLKGRGFAMKASFTLKNFQFFGCEFIYKWRHKLEPILLNFFFVNKEFFRFFLQSLAVVQYTRFFHMLQTFKLNSKNHKTGKKSLVGLAPRVDLTKFFFFVNKEFLRFLLIS